ncbi:hypothetical protein BDV96DRAFT_592718 [Lophiotrema nucula]|uniref:Uncharacterized protein n=1 Tax=Lophiotrema nucula TaxID=690887 RepID=A0A6A5YGJ7_9PLEO|nr:hypothetical protein BDV96DRAFT_592718 [Lophiotrema nucula]
MSMEYWFPMSFLSQIVRFQLAMESTGPQFALNFLRRVSDTAQCVGCAQAGNIRGLQDLFKRGLASPRLEGDVPIVWISASMNEKFAGIPLFRIERAPQQRITTPRTHVATGTCLLVV